MLPSSYFSLIRHEVKWWRTPGREKQDINRWWIISVAVSLLIGISFITYFAVQGLLNPRYLWTFSIGFPFVAFGMAYNLVNREWEGRTVGWWLTIPFSPERLIAAKFWAGLLQAGIIYLITFLGCTILASYLLLLQNSFSLMDFSELIQLGVIWFMITACASPFMAAFGILNAILARSRLKLLIILLWCLFWVFPNIIFWTTSFDSWQGSPFSFLNSPDLVWDLLSFYLLAGMIAIGITWIFAYLMIRSAGWVIKYALSL